MLTRGLVRELTDAEIEAVLAHEISHLANGDGRLLVWAVVTAVTTVQLWLCLLGVALLPRGRELAADRGAAELTGSPSTVASALDTLDGGRGRPTEDLRGFKRSAGALDILPPQDQTDLSSPFRTHPTTEHCIKRLKALVSEIET